MEGLGTILKRTKRGVLRSAKAGLVHVGYGHVFDLRSRKRSIEQSLEALKSISDVSTAEAQHLLIRVAANVQAAASGTKGILKKNLAKAESVLAQAISSQNGKTRRKSLVGAVAMLENARMQLRPAAADMMPGPIRRAAGSLYRRALNRPARSSAEVRTHGVAKAAASSEQRASAKMAVATRSIEERYRARLAMMQELERAKAIAKVEDVKAKLNSHYSEKISKIRAAEREKRLEIVTTQRDRYKADIGERTTRVRRLLAEFRKVQVHRYGSHTAGRSDWEARWDASPGRRILLYALKDYSGSFFKWADAINRHTDYAARLAVMDVHQFGYGNDLIMPFPDVLDRSDLRGLAAEADVIHIKDETGFFTGTNRLPTDLFSSLGKPVIYTAYGGYMRKFEADPEFRRHVLGYDARIAMTPDLVYDWFDGSFIPHAIDTKAFRYSWRDGRLLSHSPSTKARKGTEDLLEAVEGLDIKFDMIHGVSHQECLQRKRVANLFFDQAGTEVEHKMGNSTVIGWYGNSALEAAVFGIPTIAHLSEHAFEGARRAGRDIEDRCAIINTARGPEGIRKTITDYFAMQPAARRDLSRRTRAWMEDFHSYEACASELATVYDKVLARARPSHQEMRESQPSAGQ